MDEKFFEDLQSFHQLLQKMSEQAPAELKACNEYRDFRKKLEQFFADSIVMHLPASKDGILNEDGTYSKEGLSYLEQDYRGYISKYEDFQKASTQKPLKDLVDNCDEELKKTLGELYAVSKRVYKKLVEIKEKDAKPHLDQDNRVIHQQYWLRSLLCCGRNAPYSLRFRLNVISTKLCNEHKRLKKDLEKKENDYFASLANLFKTKRNNEGTGDASKASMNEINQKKKECADAKEKLDEVEKKLKVLKEELPEIEKRLQHMLEHCFKADLKNELNSLKFKPELSKSVALPIASFEKIFEKIDEKEKAKLSQSIALSQKSQTVNKIPKISKGSHESTVNKQVAKTGDKLVNPLQPMPIPIELPTPGSSFIRKNQ